jgi:alpha-glucosidase
VWIGDAAQQSRYVRPGELHLVFNFRLLFSGWDSAGMRQAIESSTHELLAVGAASTWVLSNHDVVRHPTRYGGGEVGLRRARAALLLILALPGAVFTYQGEELGLEEVDLPDAALQDPIWENSGHTERGRDGCRVPLPWSGEVPPYGFTTADRSWLPQPVDWGPLTVQAQHDDADSMLGFYRSALARRPRTLDTTAPLTWNRSDAVLDLTVAGAPGIRIVVNLGADPVALPAGEVLLASGPVTDGKLPTDTAVWLTP